MQRANEQPHQRSRSTQHIAGLIPLVVATGPGALGNRTIGASALGGMLFGTLFGVIIVPGLYYVFGTLAAGRSLIRDEEDRSVTEQVTHPAEATHNA
jgi:HAE1 family hydrophobic/amphiphilic exporter-1